MADTLTVQQIQSAPTAQANAPVDASPVVKVPKVITTIARDFKDASGKVIRSSSPVIFLETEFKRGDRKAANLTYPCPDFDNMSLAQIIDFAGEDFVKDEVAARLALRMQTYAWEATPTSPMDSDEVKDITGPMDLVKFSTFVQNFEARGESVADLQARSNALTLSLPTIKDAAKVKETIDLLVSYATRIQQANDSKAARAAAKAAEEAAAKKPVGAAK